MNTPHPTPPATVTGALVTARHAGLARIDAQLLLLHALGKPPHDRAWLISHDDHPLSAHEQQSFEQLLQQRSDGVPVAYLTGRKEFFGLPLHITSATLDPRPDTEILVEWALDVLQPLKSPRVLDLGTGSGAIALAIQHQRPDAQVWAVDQSAAALQVAQANGQRLGLAVQWLQGDWFEPVHAAHLEPFDLVVSNPPYIESNDPHLPSLRHEPLDALISGEDGLDDIRRIAKEAIPHLNHQGHLLIEHGWNQAERVAQLLQNAGYQAVSHRSDLGGHLRCSGGQRHSLP